MTNIHGLISSRESGIYLFLVPAQAELFAEESILLDSQMGSST